jgi:hypothetical protein
MKNVYVGDAVKSMEIQRFYEEYYEDMHNSIWMSENDGILEILLYEDYRIPNNPFSEIKSFPLNVTFSFEKLVYDKNFVYNIWEIKIPIILIEKVIEEYDNEIPDYEYNIIFKDGSKLIIFGNWCFFSSDGRSCMFGTNPEKNDLVHINLDMYNKVEISCEISGKEILSDYLKNKLESETNYLKRTPKLNQYKEATRERIAEIKKQLRNIEMEDE